MSFSLSPAVTIREIDLTTVVPTVSTTVGAFAGNFAWGPADVVNLVDSEGTLVALHTEPGPNTYIDFFTAANFLSYGNNLQVARSVGANANNSTADGSGIRIKNEDVWHVNYANGSANVGQWAARYIGGKGDALSVSICPSGAAYSSNLGATANTTAGSNTVNFSADMTNFIAVGDVLRIGTMTGIPVANVNTLTVTLTSNATDTLVSNTVGRDWKYKSLFSKAPGTSDYALSLGASNDQIHIVVIDRLGTFSDTGANTVLEKFAFTSVASDATNNDGTTNYYRDSIFNLSSKIYWMGHPTGATNWGQAARGGIAFTQINKNAYNNLSGGVTDNPTDANREITWGLFADPEIIDISLVLSSNASTTLGSFLMQNISAQRMDCLTFISPQFTDVVQQPTRELNNILATNLAYSGTSYAVLDNNWKYQFDKYNNVYRWLPLNGDIAGLCVRTDSLRDPWWSPAGYNRGQIKNCIKLAWNANKAQRDALYQASVNPVVSFKGVGPMLFGDKTFLNQPSAFSRINVRRLFIVLEKAIATAAKFSLFEFNDEFTRAQFVNLVDPFLRDIQGRRGIEAYRIVCDTTNNPDIVIDNNEFVGSIFVTPARSINEIELNFVAVGTGVDFNEIVGRVGV